MGSRKCLKCHTGLTSPHVERWLRIKFKTFELVKKAPDYIAGNEGYRKTCLKCHTTGYDETTGKYSEGGLPVRLVMAREKYLAILWILERR